MCVAKLGCKKWSTCFKHPKIIGSSSHKLAQMGCCFKPHIRTNTKIKGSNMEIAEGALAMAAKNKIDTEIAGLAKPQTTKRTTHPHKYKKAKGATWKSPRVP